MQQQIFEDVTKAKDAVEMSKGGNKFAAVIFSRGKYYVEDEAPLVRNGESLEAQYENGKKIK